MKKAIPFLSLFAAIALADSAQIWMTSRSVIQWDAPVDSNRTGWNVALVNSLTQSTNLYASDAARASDTANTNGVLKWVTLTDPTVTRLDASALVKYLNWQNGNVVCSARDASGNYSDWATLSVYNPSPSNLRLK